MHARRGTIACILWSLFVGLALALSAPRASPLKRGSPNTFWYLACRINLGGVRPELMGDFHGPRDGWLYYEISHMHGSELYRLPYAEASPCFERVFQMLQSKREDLPQRVKDGLEHWHANPGAGMTKLLEDIKKAQLDRYECEDANMYAFVLRERQAFEERLRRAKWYWASILFEWCLLSGLGLLVIWPMIRPIRPWRLALHLGLAPILFFLPVYLGYATFTFTSAGPGGGIVYPWLVALAPRLDMNDWDRAIMDHMPQVLEPLPQPIGSPMALTGMGFPSPTGVLCIGLVVGLATFATQRFAGCKRRNC
ncbi:MAG: hypothetical protein ACHRHE_06620 [Tepidisphaerales bacterium]